MSRAGVTSIVEYVDGADMVTSSQKGGRKMNESRFEELEGDDSSRKQRNAIIQRETENRHGMEKRVRGAKVTRRGGASIQICVKPLVQPGKRTEAGASWIDDSSGR